MILVAALLVMALPLEQDPAFAEGRRLYEASEYEQAIFRLQEAALVVDRPSGERAQALMWLGLAYAGFGDTPAARHAFGDAIRLDPAIAAPIEISPKVTAELEAVREQVTAERAQALAAAASARPAAPAPSEGGPPWALVAGVGALGTICVVAGAIATGFAVVNDGVVHDLETFQDDAARAQDERDAQVLAAAVLFGAGTVLLGGGGVVLAAGLPE